MINIVFWDLPSIIAAAVFVPLFAYVLYWLGKLLKEFVRDYKLDNDKKERKQNEKRDIT